MPNIQISKLKARRGTDSQRSSTTFDQGELVATTDTKRLFVGDGVSSGGSVVGSKIHPPVGNEASLISINAQIGDLVLANNIFYQLISEDYTDFASWRNVGPSIDSDTFEYDGANFLTLKDGSITSDSIDPNAIGDGLQLDGSTIAVLTDTNTLDISSGQLIVADDGIHTTQIHADSFGNGITGGSGSTIELNVNTNQFTFSGGVLNADIEEFTLSFEDLDSGWFGRGITSNSGTNKIELDPTWFGGGIQLSDTTSQVELDTTDLAATSEWAQINVDDYGRVTTVETSIYDALTGSNTNNSLNSLSSIFNGSPATSLSGAVPGINLTEFTVLSSDGSTVALSSAGFLTFEGNTTTRTGETVGRFAIPIFAY